MKENSALKQYEVLHQSFVDFLKVVAKALLIPEILDVLTGWLSKLRFE